MTPVHFSRGAGMTDGHRN